MQLPSELYPLRVGLVVVGFWGISLQWQGVQLRYSLNQVQLLIRHSIYDAKSVFSYSVDPVFLFNPILHVGVTVF